MVPLRKSDPENHHTLVAFITDDEHSRNGRKTANLTQPIQFNDDGDKFSKTFSYVHKQQVPAGSMVEIYSDSLNTKSEEKKNNSNSNDDEHRSSPSFYKLNASGHEL